MDRLNPTSKGSSERAEKDKMLNSIVSSIQTSNQNMNREPDYRTLNLAETPKDAHSPVKKRQALTMEQKRIKRKVLKIMDTESSDFCSKLRAKGELGSNVLVEDQKIESDLNQVR